MEERWSDLAKQLWWEMTPQTNYHGTPYSFNKFDDSRFLTGEGAMAHGTGHYSADNILTANKYNINKLDIPENFVDRYELPNRFLDFDEQTQRFSIRNKIHQLNTFATDNSYPEQLRQSWIRKATELKNFLDHLGYIEGNTYKVNVPNENFMLREDLPLNEQKNLSQLWDDMRLSRLKHNTSDLLKFKAALINNNIDINKRFGTKYFNKALDMVKSNPAKYLDISDINNYTGKDLYGYLARENGGSKKANEILSKLGVKGIRAKGNIDGPINVTFSGKNIKMANTPWQRFVNRIPTQTLGKMASKLYNTPGVKQAIKFSSRVATPLMILDGIGWDQPVGQSSDQPPIYPINGKLEGYITNKY